MRKDVISAYLAAGAKVGSWMIITAIVYRCYLRDYAMLALLRATIGILTYTSLGLAPAMIHMLAKSRGKPQPVIPSSDEGPILSYATPTPQDPTQGPYSNGLIVTIITACFGLLVTIVYANRFVHWHEVPSDLVGLMPELVLMMGLGMVLRLASDASGAMLQTRGKIARDNAYLIGGECAWIVFTIAIIPGTAGEELRAVAIAFVMSGTVVFIARFVTAAWDTGLWVPKWSLVSRQAIGSLLGFGILVAIAQLADYLYAPTDYILINHFLGNIELAAYAPAVQIDAGLLLLVSGLAAVLLPKAALAHADRDTGTIRKYYLSGTLFSTAILLIAAAAVYFASPLIFRIWLKDPLPLTHAILPLILIHTVVGGSSAVGRSILLAVGKVRPFTASVLIAGVVNVVLSYSFVHFWNLGLKGIVLGTIVAVVGRCGVWMPWYMMRTLKRLHPTEDAVAANLPAI